MTERSQARRTRTAAGVAMLAAALLVLGGAGLATARVMEGTASEAAEMAVGSETALSLAEVLRSVERHHPLVAAVLEERAMADARQLASRGAFDLRVEAGSKLKPEGFYETYEAGVGLKQPTTLWGSEFYAGYRIGDGDFAAWDGDLLTNEGGEFRAGVRVPLLRDRAIDKRRAGLREADLDVAVSTPLIERNLLELRQAATMAYWEWVSSGMRVSLARQLLEIAEVRQVQLKRRVDRGAVPEIDLVDNERLILERQARRIDAERAFEQATVNLGLFLRDENGMPRPARAENLPRGFPEEFKPDSASLESDVEEALERQPLLQQLALEIEKAELKLQLAENRYLPGLAVSVGASNDVGAAAKFPDDKGPAVLEARLEFELPVQRREARKTSFHRGQDRGRCPQVGHRADRRPRPGGRHAPQPGAGRSPAAGRRAQARPRDQQPALGQHPRTAGLRRRGQTDLHPGRLLQGAGELPVRDRGRAELSACAPLAAQARKTPDPREDLGA